MFHKCDLGGYLVAMVIIYTALMGNWQLLDSQNSRCFRMGISVCRVYPIFVKGRHFLSQIFFPRVSVPLCCLKALLIITNFFKNLSLQKKYLMRNVYIITDRHCHKCALQKSLSRLLTSSLRATIIDADVKSLY